MKKFENISEDQTSRSNRFKEYLIESDIAHQWFEHPAIFTVAEGHELLSHIPGRGTKNLFLVEEKTDSFHLINVCEKKRVDLNQLRRMIGSGKRFSFASPENLLKLLGLTPGSVSPLGLLMDTNRTVSFAIDGDLKNESWIQIHPFINSRTLVISPQDLEKIFSIHQIHISWVNIPQKES